MKKKILILNIIVGFTAISLQNCNDTKIDNCAYKLNNVVKEKNKIVYNGYDKDECIKGCVACTDHYYKLLFVANKKYFVTKKAYSSGYSTYEIARPQQGGSYVYDKYCSVCAYIRNKADLKNLQEATYEWISYDIYNIISAHELHFNIEEVTMLKKKKYNDWMNEHPETKELQY